MKTYEQIRLEKIKEILGDVDYDNENITDICKYWKPENIKLLEWRDFNNYNIRDICEYWKPENIELLKWQDFTNENIYYVCKYGEPELIKARLNQ